MKRLLRKVCRNDGIPLSGAGVCRFRAFPGRGGPPVTGPAMPPSLAEALRLVSPQRLTALPPSARIVLVDDSRQGLVQTFANLLLLRQDFVLAGFHVTHEAPPEPLHIGSLPPVPHLALEKALALPGVIPVIGMRVPFEIIAGIHKNRRDYLIMPAPNCYAPYVFEQVPDFYETRREQLEAVYSLLSGDDSKRAFASVVRARMTGESAYITPVGEMYGHPPTAAVPGDIVVDGGVHAFDSDLRQLSLDAGAAGSVHSFEPERDNYRQILADMAGHVPANITLVDKGLFSRKQTLNITRDQSSSTVVAEAGERTEPCEVVALDEYVMENGLPRVDLIKMDIEGAEMEALRGAQNVIRQYGPKLKISAYHTVDHLWEIPLFLHSLVPDHAFAFRTPAPYLVEYLLFAYPARRA